MGKGLKKFLVISLIAAFVAGMMPGCAKSDSGTSSKGGKVTITFLSLSNWDDYLKPIVAEFEKENPNIAVNVESYSITQLSQVIEVKMGANSKDYDVLAVDAPKLAGYTEKGYMLPIDKYFSEADQKAITPSSLKTSFWKNQLIALPMNTSSQLLYYNKDLLKQAGVAFPSEDTGKRLTWEELVPMAQKVMKATDPSGDKGIMGFMFEQINTTYQIDALANQLGGKCIGDDGYTVDGVINTPAWIKACQFYQDLFNKYKISHKGVSATDTVSYWKAGKIAFFVAQTNYITPSVGKVNFGYAPQPYFQGGTPATPNDSWHLGIPKNSLHAEEAAKFIKFLCIGKGADLYYQERGTLPSTVSLINTINTDSAYEKFPKSGLRIAEYEVTHTAVSRPQTPGYSEWDSVMSNTYADISNGSDVKTSLDNAVKQINNALAKYKK